MNQASGEQLEANGDHGLASAAFEVSPHAQFVVDGNGLLAAFNERARGLFGLTAADTGRPFHHLELSWQPVELRSLIAQVFEQLRPLHVRDVPWDATGRGTRFFDVHVAPVNGAGAPAVSIAFIDISETHDLQLQLNRSKQELGTACRELQSTNEELETVNEELQSTIEQLETTNQECSRPTNISKR